MNTLVVVGSEGTFVVLRALASICAEWFFDFQHDPAETVRALKSDGFEVDLSSQEVEGLRAQVILERMGPYVQAEHIKLQRFLPSSSSARAIQALLKNNAEFGCLLSNDIQLDVFAKIVEGVAAQNDGYVNAAILFERAADQIALATEVSIWPNAPEFDVRDNVLVACRNPSLVELLDVQLAEMGVVRCGTLGQALARWKIELQGCFLVRDKSGNS